MHMIHDRKGSNFISSSSKTLKKPSGHLFCGFDIQVHILLSSKHSDKPHTVFFQSGFFQKINCPLVFCQNISYISSCDLLFGVLIDGINSGRAVLFIFQCIMSGKIIGQEPRPIVNYFETCEIWPLTFLKVFLKTDFSQHCYC